MNHYCDSHPTNSLRGAAAANSVSGIRSGGGGGGGQCVQWSSAETAGLGGGCNLGVGNCSAIQPSAGTMCPHGNTVPPPLQQSMMSGGGGHGHNGSLLGSHISLSGIAIAGRSLDDIMPPSAASAGHCRSLSGLNTLSLGLPAAPLPPPPIFNPCSSNSISSMSMQGPSSSRWGPRTSCPVHSPFRVRAPNGSICSGHQVNFFVSFVTRSLRFLNVAVYT